MEIRYCEECGNGYAYVDSPPAEKCFCGGQLIESEGIIQERFFGDVEYPTVSY